LRLGFPVGSVQRAKADEVWPGNQVLRVRTADKIKTAGHRRSVLARRRSNRAILARSLAGIPAEALVMATSTNAELLALSGKRNPVRQAHVVEQGALADCYLSTEITDNINLIADPPITSKSS
jgi:hypothetical protein